LGQFCKILAQRNEIQRIFSVHHRSLSGLKQNHIKAILSVISNLDRKASITGATFPKPKHRVIKGNTEAIVRFFLE
jgi:hypothetical protein